MNVPGPLAPEPVEHAPQQTPPPVRSSTPNARPRLSGRDRWIFAAILLGALLMRLAVLWMPGDQMFENGSPAFEELQRGNATNDLLHGPLLPILDYKLNDFSGGSLAVSILGVPFFWLFGPTFNALRLVSLLFSVPLVLVAFLLAYRWHGRRAAIVASSLLAFGPPGFTFLSCTVYGTHPEANLIALVLVFLFLAWREAGRGGIVRTLLFGTTIGFALWFSYGLCVIVGVLIVCDFAATGIRPVRKADLPLGAGFLIGFSPWILNMVRHPGQAFHIYGSSITEHIEMGVKRGDGLQKLEEVAMRDGPNAFWMHHVWPGYGGLIASCLFFVLVLVVAYSTWAVRGELGAFFRALVGRRRGFQPTLRLVSVLFVFAWLTAFTLSDFRIDTYMWVQGYRYLMPFYPFVAVLFGIAVQDLALRGRVIGPTVLVVSIVCANVGLTLAQLRPDRMREHWSEPGTNGKWHLRMLVNRFGYDAQAIKGVLQRAIERRTEAEQVALVDGLARGITLMATKPSVDRWAEDRRLRYEDALLTLIAEAPEQFRPVFQKAWAQAPKPPESR